MPREVKSWACGECNRRFTLRDEAAECERRDIHALNTGAMVDALNRISTILHTQYEAHSGPCKCDVCQAFVIAAGAAHGDFSSMRTVE